VSALHLYFRAGGVRYAIEATSVIEVASVALSSEALRGHFVLANFAALMGGADRLPGTSVIVFDSSPSLAARVDEVVGVLSARQATRPPMTPALKAVLAPKIQGALLNDVGLWFELTLDALQSKTSPPEPFFHLVKAEPCREPLFFLLGEQLYEVPFDSVVQVLPLGGGYNGAPFSGALFGAQCFREQVLPLVACATATAPQWTVVIEVNGACFGLVADSVGKSSHQFGARESLSINLAQSFS
jgi:hypothetical protein